jgi:sortase A
MRRRTIAVSVAAILLAACGNDGGGAADTTSTIRSTTTERATTTTRPRPTTTASTSTTLAATTTTSTTIAPTTVPPTLPVPAAPPEPRAKEPVVELGRIEMPALGIEKPLLEGVSLTVLDHGPGHWPGTAMPGHMGNVVIGGHRTSHDKPFRHIDDLAPGDEVVFTTSEGRFVYKVTSTEVVYPDAIWIIDQTQAYTATLFACHPVGSTKQRLVVHLEMVADA